MFDWLTPCDGCPRCGYAYQREEGYFLLAIWGVNYGVVAGLAVVIGFMFEWLHPLTIKQYILFLFVPMPILSLLLARHAKSLFLAMDHFFDPHGFGQLISECSLKLSTYSYRSASIGSSRAAFCAG